MRFGVCHELRIRIRINRNGFGDLYVSIWVTEACLAALVWINHLNYSIMRAQRHFNFFWMLSDSLFWKKINIFHDVGNTINGSLWTYSFQIWVPTVRLLKSHVDSYTLSITLKHWVVSSRSGCSGWPAWFPFKCIRMYFCDLPAMRKTSPCSCICSWAVPGRYLTSN